VTTTVTLQSIDTKITFPKPVIQLLTGVSEIGPQVLILSDSHGNGTIRGKATLMTPFWPLFVMIEDSMTSLISPDLDLLLIVLQANHHFWLKVKSLHIVWWM
jgi:hypothetical protein